LIEVKNLWKIFKLYQKPSDRLKELLLRKNYHIDFAALKGVSFSIKNGEVLGIVGPNGSGKSTLLKILTGVIFPDKGEVKVKGKIAGILELGTGFNFELTGLENIYFNGMLLGMSKNEIEEKKEAIIEFSELQEFINEPLKVYSTGMVMRLAFSIAVHTDPDCFLIDEALAVGDAHFQQKCMKKIKEFKKKGKTIIFVSHDMNAVKLLCDKAILLHKGEILDEGRPEKVINTYNFLLAKLEEKENYFVVKEKKSSYGSFEVKILKVELIGIESQSRIVASGEMVNVKIKCKAFKDIPELTLGILIRDRFAQDIFGINTALLEKNLNLKTGEICSVIFKFPMNIAPGKYTLTVAAHAGKSHSERCYHWIDNAISFEVVGYKHKVFIGVAYLPTQVQVVKE